MTAPPTDRLGSSLAAICGVAHVIVAPQSSVAGIRPAFAVAPASLEEAAAVLSLAREAGATVTPWGGGSQQLIGPPPPSADIVLETSRWSAVVEWEAADLTACLQSGLTLDAVQRMLAEQGQQLPVDAPGASRATLGGLVATNTTGPRRWLHGGWRDLIIGMHMALAGGTVIKSGGRVVKNVQGYDLAKLFTGALGTLGVIGQVNVKLVPLEPVRRLLIARGARPAVASFLAAVAASQTRVAAIDLLDSGALIACGLPGGGDAGLVLIEGRAATVDAQSSVVQSLALAAGARCESINGAALDPVWRAWIDLGRLDDLGAREALLTVSARPAEVEAIVGELVQLSEQSSLSGRTWARAGNGTVYARIRAESADGATAIGSVQAALLPRWPATTVTAADPAIRTATRPWGADPAGIAVMRALKARFDPTGVLQPGRFAGGI